MNEQQRKAIEMALEAFESMKETLAEHGEPTTFNEDEAFTAIKDLLAQPEQEPVAYLSEGGNFSFEPWQRSIPLYTTPPQRKEPEQEPVAWMTPDGEGFRIRFSPPVNDVPLGWDALYTTPPTQQGYSHKRKPLTNEQILEMWGLHDVHLGIVDFVRAVEAAHGIKE